MSSKAPSAPSAPSAPPPKVGQKTALRHDAMILSHWGGWTFWEIKVEFLGYPGIISGCSLIYGQSLKIDRQVHDTVIRALI